MPLPEKDYSHRDLRDVGVMDGIVPLRVLRVTFDASIVGNRSIGNHDSGLGIPANSVILGGFQDVNTLFTSAGANAGTIAINIEAAGDIQIAAACSGQPYLTIGEKAIVPKFNTPESSNIKTTVARNVVFVVAGQALLTGKLTLFLFYVDDIVSA